MEFTPAPPERMPAPANSVILANVTLAPGEERSFGSIASAEGRLRGTLINNRSATVSIFVLANPGDPEGFPIRPGLSVRLEAPVPALILNPNAENVAISIMQEVVE